MNPDFVYFDALYGSVRFVKPFASLIAAPVVQRLRHVRLSNIDSVAMPGIANISRYEHVLGVGHLAQNTNWAKKLSRFDQITLTAAGLLHDWGITAFGHLVEEAFRYRGNDFDHERRLQDIIGSDDETVDVGGIGRQVLCGRQTGLRPWARAVVGDADADSLLKAITETVLGRGRLGSLIAGSIDLDNIDNVYRVAFHMGLDIDRSVPLRLAKSISGICESGELVFPREARQNIDAWVRTRREVYERLMPAESDFALKLMILFAGIEALKANEVGTADWHLTDNEYIALLQQSSVTAVRDTVARWMTGELWNITPLYWIAGNRPSFSALYAFSDMLGRLLKRPCLAYGIKDKRERRFVIHFEGDQREEIGVAPTSWLLGVGSPKREGFTSVNVEAVLDLAAGFFQAEVLGPAKGSEAAGQVSARQLGLF